MDRNEWHGKMMERDRRYRWTDMAWTAATLAVWVVVPILCWVAVGYTLWELNRL